MQRASTEVGRLGGAVGADSWLRTFRAVACVVGFSLLTAICAQIRVPVPGSMIPMTLQSTAVLLTGFCLSPALAVAAMLLYVAAGLTGAPVFVPGSLGLAGLTGGYIVGFVVGAAVVALLCGRSNGIARLVFAGVVGTVVIFLCGVIWQMAFFDVGMVDVWAGGVLPFVPKAVVQIGVAVAAVRLMGRARRLSDRML